MPLNKMLTLLCSLLFSLLCFTNTQGQTVDTDTLKRRPRKELAFERIIKLKEDGALFVRLKTRNKTTEALEKLEKEEEAKKILFKQAPENKTLALSFASQFDFCPVYFFFSDDSEHFRNRAFDKIQFVNENLEPTDIEVETDFALGAELGRVNIDKGNSVIDIYSILILDEDLYQMNRPFPFYSPVASVEKMFLTQPIGAAVTRLNEKFLKFHKRALRKTAKWEARAARKLGED